MFSASPAKECVCSCEAQVGETGSEVGETNLKVVEMDFKVVEIELKVVEFTPKVVQRISLSSMVAVFGRK